MRHADSSDDELLLATARDADAFEAYFRRRAPAVLAYFARRVDDPEAAADLMAETFAAALIAAPRFRRTGAPAQAWLFAIARNKLADHRRAQATAMRALKRVGVERIALDDADLERIRELAGVDLSDLSDEQRAAVQARVVDERDYDDIAAEAGTSQAVIRQRVSRGLATLRKGITR